MNMYICIYTVQIISYHYIGEVGWTANLKPTKLSVLIMKSDNLFQADQ